MKKRKYFKEGTKFTTDLVVEYLMSLSGRTARLKDVKQYVYSQAAKMKSLMRTIEVGTAINSILSYSAEAHEKYGGRVIRESYGNYAFVPDVNAKSKALFPEFDRGAIQITHRRITHEEAMLLCEKLDNAKNVIDHLFMKSILLVKLEVR